VVCGFVHVRAAGMHWHRHALRRFLHGLLMHSMFIIADYAGYAPLYVAGSVTDAMLCVMLLVNCRQALGSPPLKAHIA
jgi:hypothetical protein